MNSFSIWHWLVLALVLLVIGLPAYFSIRSARAERGVITPGFKGWLLIFAIVIVIAVLRAGSEFLRAWQVQDEVSERFPLLTQMDVVAGAITLALAYLCAQLMFTRSRYFPKAYVAFSVWAVVSVPVSVIAASIVLNNVYGIPMTVGQAMQNASAEMGRWFAGLTGWAIWLAYIFRSRRVALTFSS